MHSLLRRRATIACGYDHWLAKTRTKAAAAQLETDANIDRLQAVLTARGYGAGIISAGIPDLYDCNGWVDNTQYGTVLRFPTTHEILRFLKDIDGALPHLQGPGTADLSIKVRHGAPGGELHFNPWLAGILANHLERVTRRDESAVGQGGA